MGRDPEMLRALLVERSAQKIVDRAGINFGTSQVINVVGFTTAQGFIALSDPQVGGAEFVDILQVTFDKPRPISVFLAIDPQQLLDRTHLIGKVQWGSGGTNSTAFIDFISGASFNISAEFLSVQACAWGSAVAAGVVGTVKAIAYCSDQAFPSGSSPQRTLISSADVLNTATFRFFNPPFAKDVSVNARNTATGNARQVDLNDTAANNGYTVLVGSGQPCPSLLIPSSTKSVLATNLSGNTFPAGTLQAVYGLSL